MYYWHRNLASREIIPILFFKTFHYPPPSTSPLTTCIHSERAESDWHYQKGFKPGLQVRKHSVKRFLQNPDCPVDLFYRFSQYCSNFNLMPRLRSYYYVHPLYRNQGLSEYTATVDIISSPLLQLFFPCTVLTPKPSFTWNYPNTVFQNVSLSFFSSYHFPFRLHTTTGKRYCPNFLLISKFRTGALFILSAAKENIKFLPGM